jgi:hypothetical protein
MRYTILKEDEDLGRWEVRRFGGMEELTKIKTANIKP